MVLEMPFLPLDVVYFVPPGGFLCPNHLPAASPARNQPVAGHSPFFYLGGACALSPCKHRWSPMPETSGDENEKLKNRKGVQGGRAPGGRQEFFTGPPKMAGAAAAATGISRPRNYGEVLKI